MAFAVKPKTGARSMRKLPEGEEPEQNLESEGNKYIKDQVKKQTDTRLTLNEALKQEKEFTPGMGYVRLNKGGQNSLNELEDLLQSVKRQEDLTSNKDHLLPGEGRRLVTRDELETALAVKPGSVETKLLGFTLRCDVAEDSILNHLRDELEADPKALAKTIRRKRKQQLEETVQKAAQKISGSSSSMWDVEQVEEKKIRTAVKKPEAVERPRLQRDGSADSRITFVMDEHTQAVVLGKKSDEEIRLLPAFSEYTRGHPSKGIFLKNLTKSMTEEKLGGVLVAALREAKLGHEGVTLRLLGGRMRGQAFIQTQSITDATKVLEILNGTILDRRPIVAQYSKRNT